MEAGTAVSGSLRTCHYSVGDSLCWNGNNSSLNWCHASGLARVRFIQDFPLEEESVEVQSVLDHLLRM